MASQRWDAAYQEACRSVTWAWYEAQIRNSKSDRISYYPQNEEQEKKLEKFLAILKRDNFLQKDSSKSNELILIKEDVCVFVNLRFGKKGLLAVTNITF